MATERVTYKPPTYRLERGTDGAWVIKWRIGRNTFVRYTNELTLKKAVRKLQRLVSNDVVYWYSMEETT